MNTVTSATIGVLFLILSFAATFLMFYLWGFPFEKTTRTSTAPKWHADALDYRICLRACLRACLGACLSHHDVADGSSDVAIPGRDMLRPR